MKMIKWVRGFIWFVVWEEILVTGCLGFKVLRIGLRWVKIFILVNIREINGKFWKDNFNLFLGFR